MRFISSNKKKNENKPDVPSRHTEPVDTKPMVPTRESIEPDVTRVDTLKKKK